jgi:Zn-dependent protease
VFGIPIRLDFSLIFLMGLICYDTTSVFESFAVGLLFGGVYAFLLLLSIVLHELGHSLAAMRFGCRVRAITLMVFGGRAELSHIPTKPIQEFIVAICGPLVSMALWLVGKYGSIFLQRYMSESSFLGNLGIGMFSELGYMNFMLFIFNLIPAFPMDGGRVLRATLAHRLGRLRATKIAATVGRGLAMAGIAYVLVYEVFPGGFSMNSMFRILIAMFIFQAAGQEYKMVQLESYYERNGERAPWAPPPPPPDIYVSPPPYAQPKPKRRWWQIFRKDDDNS